MSGTGANESEKWASLQAEMEAPDRDPVVARIEAGQPDTQPEPEAEPGSDRYVSEQSDRYLDDPRSVDERLTYSRQQDREPEPRRQYQQPDAPDVDVDPIGHFNARLAAMERAAGVSRQPTQRERQEYVGTAGGRYTDVNDNPIEHMQQRFAHMEQDGQGRDFMLHLQRSEEAAKAEIGADNYEEACAHLLNARDAELRHMYPRSTSEQRRAYVMQEAMQVADQAFRSGQEPGAVFYQLAQQRGYQTRQRIPNSIKKQMLRVADEGSGREFDAMWGWYAAQEKAAEAAERAHRQRVAQQRPWRPW